MRAFGQISKTVIQISNIQVLLIPVKLYSLVEFSRNKDGVGMSNHVQSAQSNGSSVQLIHADLQTLWHSCNNNGEMQKMILLERVASKKQWAVSNRYYY